MAAGDGDDDTPRWAWPVVESLSSRAVALSRNQLVSAPSLYLAPRMNLQVVGHVRADKYSLTISHLFGGLSFRVLYKSCEALECICPAKSEQVCKPNSVSHFEISDLRSEISKWDGDHSSSPTVARLDQAIYPEVVSRVIGIRAGSPVDASLFDLALRGVCLAVCVTTYAGALLL